MFKNPIRQFDALPPNAYPRNAFTCVSCDIAIGGPPTIYVGVPFCCPGCAVGGPCTCSYDERDAIVAETREPVAETQELELVLA